MKTESLFFRITLIAVAFLVFTFNYQYATIMAGGGPSGVRSTEGLDHTTTDRDNPQLRSISLKEDKLLTKLEVMSAQMESMQHLVTKSYQQQGKGGDTPANQQQQRNLKADDGANDNKELLQKISDLTSQMAEMKKVTDKLQDLSDKLGTANTNTNRAVSTTQTEFSEEAAMVAAAFATPIKDDDPCYQLRTSTTSLAVVSPYAGDCKKPFMHQLEKQPKYLSVATVIPGLAREKDFNYFPKVLKSLEAQTVPSNEVVIAISGVFDRVGVRHKHKFHDSFSSFELKKANKFCNGALETFQKHYKKSPIKLICIGERLSSGRARNAAVSATTSDILTFIDSDDTAYPIRNEVVRNVFNDTMDCRKQDDNPPLLVLLHSHKKKPDKDHPYEKERGYKLPPTNKVLPGNEWTGTQCLEKEKGLGIEHGRQLLASMASRPSSWKISDEVANGHPVIRRRAFDKVHFSSIPKGQDIILLRDLMFSLSPREAELSVLYMKRPLTTYYEVGNANADLRNLDKEKKEKEAQMATIKAKQQEQKAAGSGAKKTSTTATKKVSSDNKGTIRKTPLKKQEEGTTATTEGEVAAKKTPTVNKQRRQ